MIKIVLHNIIVHVLKGSWGFTLWNLIRLLWEWKDDVNDCQFCQDFLGCFFVDWHGYALVDDVKYDNNRY